VKQWVAIIAVFLGSLLVTAFVGFFLALILVGPHSDILPGVLRVPAGLLLWSGVLGIPSWLSWATYRKFKRRDNVA
jgi:hypothetical protein